MRKVGFDSYAAFVGSGICSQLPALIKSEAKLDLCRLLLVCDNNTGRFADALLPLLLSSGYKAEKLTLEGGETLKSPENYIKLVSYLSAGGFSRSDAVIAVGGGTVGDLCGFAASTYMRGIALIMIPTTLLSAVDSSVGGKNAIDLPDAKNALGTIYRPSLVAIDTDALLSLGEDEIKDGFAEIVKYAVIGGGALYDSVRNGKCTLSPDELIQSCLEIKADIVREDEFDRSARKVLNLGHTAAHAIEALSGYTVPHGRAVAQGLCVTARYCAKKGICSEDCAKGIIGALRAFGLKTYTDYSPEELFDASMSDKKRIGESFDLVVIEKIGKVRVERVPLDGLKEFFFLGCEL